MAYFDCAATTKPTEQVIKDIEVGMRDYWYKLLLILLMRNPRRLYLLPLDPRRIILLLKERMIIWIFLVCFVLK